MKPYVRGMRKELLMFFSLKSPALAVAVWAVIGLSVLAEGPERLSVMLIRCFGGVGRTGQLNIMELTRWIGGIVPCVMITLTGFSRGMSGIAYTLPRLGSRKVWWRRKMTAVISWSLLYFLLSLSAVVVISAAGGLCFDLPPLELLLYPLMLAASGMLLCVISTLFNQRATLSVFVAVWGLCAILGSKSRSASFPVLLYGCYGMANQIKSARDALYVCAAQIIVTASIWLLGGRMMKFKEGQRFYD